MTSAFLAAAERIGARLCRDALRSNGQCNWTADFADRDKIVGHRALTADLYDGTSGIALFLHRLSEATGERIFRLTAEAALRQACSRLPLEDCGLYAGAAGVRYAELCIRGEVDRSGLLRDTVPNPHRLDIISGSAGVIAVLLAAYRRLRHACLLDRAVEHGELLVTRAERSDEGFSWLAGGITKNLTGFSHGTAGIGWALLELLAATGDGRFLKTALGAFAYERAHFNAELGNWPDFRQQPPRYMNAWCHGAAGIGLSRVRAWELTRDEQMRSEAELALNTVVAQLPSAANWSLCHGGAGNGDILIYASQTLNRPDLIESAQASAARALEYFEQRGLPWPCGLAGASELPDLMLGLAGIAHFYLRLTDPRLPTPLLPL